MHMFVSFWDRHCPGMSITTGEIFLLSYGYVKFPRNFFDSISFILMELMVMVLFLFTLTCFKKGRKDMSKKIKNVKIHTNCSFAV